MGFEPMTSSLPRKCSTTELQQPPVFFLNRKTPPLAEAASDGKAWFSRLNGAMERVAGIEPARSAWKADVLPLNYTRRLVRSAPPAPKRPDERKNKCEAKQPKLPRARSPHREQSSAPDESEGKSPSLSSTLPSTLLRTLTLPSHRKRPGRGSDRLTAAHRLG